MFDKRNISIDDFVKNIEKEIENKTIYEVTKHLIKSENNKGSIGNHIQEYYFGIKPNNRNEADFKELDIELKVTPMVKVKNDFLRSKERLVFSLISYKKIINEINLYESSFINKNRNILVIFYEYLENKRKDNFKIIKVKLFDLLKLDEINQIEKDYNLIVNKILSGEAHLISGSDTKILEACTKSSNSLVLKDQPFSTIKAKPRAWAFKNFFMTILYHRSNKIDFDSKYSSVIDVINQINLYKNKSINYLNNIFSNFSKSKSARFSLILKMLAVKKINLIKPLVEEDVVIKTINLESDFSLIEHIPLCKVILDEMYKNFDFENSNLFDIVTNKKIIFIIFQKQGSEIILLGSFEYKFSKDMVVFAEKLFYNTQKIFNEGNAILKGSNTNKYFFIKASDNMFFHVRPGARDRSDTYVTQFGEVIVKQKFWLNKNILRDFLEEKILKK